MKGLISVILVGVILNLMTEQTQGAAIQCHLCKADGPAGACDKTAPGASTTCPDDVTTCKLTFTTRDDVMEKGCGALGDVKGCVKDVCICEGPLCNADNKQYLYEPTTTTPAPETTSEEQPAVTSGPGGDKGGDKGGATLIQATGLIPLLIIGGFLAVLPMKTQVC